MNLFKPYEGEKPYIFVSYAHRDSGEVIPILNKLNELGFRIWYDEGLELGCMWTESVASHLKDSELMLSFISESYMDSENCKREMNYAVGMNKKIINVFLQDTEMTPGMELQIGGIWALMKFSFDDDEKFMQKLLSAPMLYSVNLGAISSEGVSGTAPLNPEETEVDKADTIAEIPEINIPNRDESSNNSRDENEKKVKNWSKIIVSSLLVLSLIAIIVLLAVGNYTGFNQRFIKSFIPKTFKIEQPDNGLKLNIENNILRNIAVEYTKKPFDKITVGDLRGLTELYVCGDKYSFKDEFSKIKMVEGETAAKTKIGESEVVEVSRGSIENLEELKHFPDLKKLQLCFQSIKTLENSAPCSIEILDLRYNKLENLKGIENFKELRVLKADDNKLKDISDIGDLYYVEEIYLKNNYITSFYDLRKLPILKKFSVSGVSSKSLRPLFYSENLEELELTACKLMEDFFDKIDVDKLVKLKLIDCTINGFDEIEKTSLVELWLIDPLGHFNPYMLSSVKTLAFLYVDEETAKNFNNNMGFQVIVYTE